MPFKRMIKSGNICILSGIVSFILYFSSHIRHTISLCKYVKCHVFISGCWWTGGLPSSCSGLWFPSAPWIPDPASPPQTIPSVWISARQWKVQNMHMNRQYIVAASAACTEILSIQSCPFMSFRLVAHFAHNLLLSLSKLWQKAVTAMANTEENYHSHSKCCFREAFIRPGHKVLFCHSPCQFYSAYLALGGDWSRLLLLCNAYAMML